MKALILAGGFGTRLRPLSCTRPKLLFPIANEPLLDLTLQRLAANGVDDAVLAVNYMADALERYCGEERHGVRLHYSKDMPSTSETARPSQGALGTGGAIKQAQTFLEGKEPFLVLNGDILTEASYAEIVQNHSRNDGVATIALRGVEDPSRYGVVEMSEQKRVIRFIEKPSKYAPAQLINAGIYVFEPEIFKYIAAGRRCSLEREVFPKLVEEGKLFGDEIQGLWIDVGEPEDYLRANRLWLESRRTTASSPKARRRTRITVSDSVAIDEGVRVGPGSAIGPNVSLGKNVSVGENVRITNSIVFPYTWISNDVLVEGAMIGESVTVGKGVKIRRGCLVGDSAVLGDGVRLSRNVKVCPFKEISKSLLKSQNVA